MFDQAYFEKICNWIRLADNGLYDVAKFTGEPEKFIRHLLWYGRKNSDFRSVKIIDERTETEIMYDSKYTYFELDDIYITGSSLLDFLPEIIRTQRLDRHWKKLILSPKSRQEVKLLNEYHERTGNAYHPDSTAGPTKKINNPFKQKNLFDS